MYSCMSWSLFYLCLSSVLRFVGILLKGAEAYSSLSFLHNPTCIGRWLRDLILKLIILMFWPDLRVFELDYSEQAEHVLKII